MALRSPWYLGAALDLEARPLGKVLLPAHHLTTHGVIVGMTGSGKTGMLTVMLEEALRTGVPALIIDVKGDLANLLLNFPTFDSSAFLPWAAGYAAATDDRPPELIAEELAQTRKRSLEAWGISEGALRDFAGNTSVRIITPGSTAGESLHVLSALERHSAAWEADPEAARSSLSAAVSLLLRLVGRDPDPARSREHVLLSHLAEQRLRAGRGAALQDLLGDLKEPPLERIGALELNEFFDTKSRGGLAASLNTLLSSPTFASWREGASLDIGRWLTPAQGRTPAVIVSVAHLDDDERSLVLGVLLEEVLTWVRSLSGSRRLRALIAFDEVYGFLPPYPANPPTKAPLVALLKQARAFGVGVVVATQNPMDLDYRALSNAGLWSIGRLQTDGDRERIVEGLSSAHDGLTKKRLDRLIKHLAPRSFLLRDAHSKTGALLLQPRWAMSFLRGPLTRTELQLARKLAG